MGIVFVMLGEDDKTIVKCGETKSVTGVYELWINGEWCGPLTPF